MKETSDDNYLESESYLYLRKEAETILATRKYSMEEMSMDSYHKTIHELRTYQIELELQNEELLHTQTELNKGKARYAFLYENAPIGYLTMNEKGKMLTVNYAVSELLGYLPSQFKNKRLADFITPKDQDSYFLNLQKLLKTTDKQSFEVGMVKGSGLHFWVRLDWVHIKKKGDKNPQILVSLLDISDRKYLEALRKSQMRYQSIVEDQSDFMICRFFPSGELNFANNAFCEFFQKSQNEIVGVNFFQFVQKERKKIIEKKIFGLSVGQPVVDFESEVITPAQTYWLQWTCQAIFNENEELVEFQVVGQDRSKQKEHEEELEILRKNLEEFARERTIQLREINKQFQNEKRKFKEAEFTLKNSQITSSE